MLMGGSSERRPGTARGRLAMEQRSNVLPPLGRRLTGSRRQLTGSRLLGRRLIGSRIQSLKKTSQCRRGRQLTGKVTRRRTHQWRRYDPVEQTCCNRATRPALARPDPLQICNRPALARPTLVPYCLPGYTTRPTPAMPQGVMIMMTMTRRVRRSARSIPATQQGVRLRFFF